MIRIDFNGVIESEAENLWDFENSEFQSVRKIRQVLDEHPDDPDLCLNIDCDGGSVEEGLKIYDTLRNSGKNIYTNINGGCHSMAVCVLLAAPKENRSANRNARALIHKVYSFFMGALNKDDAEAYAEMLGMEEDAILDLYEERTGTDRNELKKVMDDERMHNAQSLLDLGFISKINTYNTNQYFRHMEKNSSKYESLMDKIGGLLNRITGKAVNYDYKDSEGNVVLSTEGDEDNLEVGVAATLASGEPSGTVILDDGRTVTVTDNIVTEIEEAVEVPVEEEEILVDDEKENLRAQVEELTNALSEARNAINELTASSYEPKPRKTQFTGNKKAEANVEELKAGVREKMNKVTNAKEIRRK